MRKLQNVLTHPFGIIIVQVILLLLAITCENRFISHMYATQRATQRLIDIQKQHKDALYRLHTTHNRSAVQSYVTQHLQFVPIKIALIKHLHHDYTGS